MAAIHFTNSLGLFISLLVVFMTMIGEVGLVLSEHLSEQAAKKTNRPQHDCLSHRVSA